MQKSIRNIQKCMQYTIYRSVRRKKFFSFGTTKEYDNDNKVYNILQRLK